MPVVRRLERQIQESVFKDCGLNIHLTHSHTKWSTDHSPWILAIIVMPVNYRRYGCFRLNNRIKAYKNLWCKFVADTMMGVDIDL